MKIQRQKSLQSPAVVTEPLAAGSCDLDSEGSWPTQLETRSETGAQHDGKSLADKLWIAYGVLLIFCVSRVLGRHQPLWEDEMLGWKLLSDPSWRHMVYAWKSGADGGGFLFYLSGRGWFHLFGASAVSFRFYSAACFAGAFIVLWFTLRRFYSTGIVAFALFNTWFFDGPLVVHMGEGRFYGLLMLGTVAVCWMVVKADETSGQPAYLCVLMFCCHALVTLSHLLGIVYSANLLVALMVLDRVRRRPPRIMLYLSAACAWLVLLGERTAIAASIQVGNPHFWIPQPSLANFVQCYYAFSREIGAVLVALAICLIVALHGRSADWAASMREAWKQRRPAYLLCVALLLVPAEFALEGIFGTPLFVGRYLIPAANAQVLLTAEAVRLIDWGKILPRSAWRGTGLRVAATLFFLTAIPLVDLAHFSKEVMVPKDYTARLTASLPKNLPVICEEAWLFTELMGRQAASGVQYTYMLDWPYTISDAAPRIEVTQYHLMQNWRKVGYFPNSIQYRSTFLRQHSKFLVLHTNPVAMVDGKAVIGNPLVKRFQSDHRYQVLPYRMRGATGGISAWLVCRSSCAADDHIH